MTTPELVRMALRRWWAVLMYLGLFAWSASHLVVIEPVYWTAFDVRLVPPNSGGSGVNAYVVRTTSGLAPLAGVVAAAMDTSPPPQPNVQSAPLHGIRHEDAMVIVPKNDGNQWSDSFQAALNVQIVMHDPDSVERSALDAGAQIKSALVSEQDRLGVAAEFRARAVMPPNIVVEPVSPRPTRAIAGAVLMALLLFVPVVRGADAAAGIASTATRRLLTKLSGHRHR